MVDSSGRILDENPIFAVASAESRQRLAQSSVLRRFRPGDVVLAEGDPSRHIFAMGSGSVRVFHMSDRKSVV